MPTPLHVTLEGDVRQAWRNVVLAFSYCEGGRREEYGEGEEGTRRGEEGEGMKKEEGTRDLAEGKSPIRKWVWPRRDQALASWWRGREK